MDLAHEREVLTRLDTPKTFASDPLPKWTKVAIGVALVVAVVCTVMAVEIELLSSGSLVVLMPE
jgi:hypothetical protein